MEVFDAARTMDAIDRETFLKETCRDDLEMLTEVRRLLELHELDDGPLDSPMTPQSAWLESQFGKSQHPPEHIRDYRVLRQIGAGGMGVVYLAQQDNPKRNVALKVIHPGLVNRELRRRFELEAAVLGRLDHPGIATIHEAGMFEDGSKSIPFFAMEYVDGPSLLDFVKDRNLGVRQKLELAASICDAVHHAYQKGVVHRDLKPGNILVRNDGQPKILDFGVARATDFDLQVSTLQTDVGQLIGTLQYMSPEQVEGNVHSVDTRSDGYAIGVILYEMLAEKLPYDLKGCSIAGAAKLIVGEAPLALSAVNRNFGRDLNTIALKALAKDPVHRYQSVSDLASDIRRYLNDEPISARPASATYQFAKFAQRNKALVGSVVGVFLALLAGIAGTAWQASQAMHQRDVAAEQLLRADETADLFSRMIRAVAPENARGSDPTIRQMLKETSLQLREDDSIHQAVAADTHRMLADAFWSLGNLGDAEYHARRALDLHARISGSNSAEALKDDIMVALIYSRLDRDQEAIVKAQDLLKRARSFLNPDNDTLIELINVNAYVMGQAPDADLAKVSQLDREYYDSAVAKYGLRDSRTLRAATNLGVRLVELNELQEGESLLRYVQEVRSDRLGEDHPETLLATHNLSFLQQRKGDLPGALAISEPQILIADRVLGVEHPRTIRYRLHLARIQSGMNLKKESVINARIAMDAAIKRLGPSHQDTLDARGLLVEILIGMNQVDESEPLALEQYRICVNQYGIDHPHTVQAKTLMFNIAEARSDIKKMKYWADQLRGTEWEKPALEMVRAAQAKANIEE